ncbi:MAG: UxaA family hydrolase, partial [Rubrivivax sp.]
MNAPPVIRIHSRDNVVIARAQLLGGTQLPGEGVTVAGLVPPGHKVATQAIAIGEAVRRYDQIIGHATQPIAAGQHVHVHNLAYADFARH